MREVAALAGCSRSAVSLALAGHPSIPPATRDRVRSAARRLGYRKNPLVAALMSVRRTRATEATTHASLAFLTSHVAPDSWRQAATHVRFHAAAVTRARELGFSLDEFSLGDPALRPERVAATLQARGVHGLLIAPLPGEQTTLQFDLSEFAVVGLGTSVQSPLIDRVADDHFHGAQLAFQQCLALGYRRIGLTLAANVSRRLENRWWSGFLVAQQQMPVRARFPALMPETREEIPPRLNAWIARHRLDAVIFSIRHEATLAGAPAAVGLVSLSVHDGSGQVAGVRQNERRIGEDAIDLLIGKLHRWETGPSSPPRLHLVRSEWSPGLSAPGAGQKRRALI
ncbi:MAG: LacI family DNA-binding transcriptional regulator [Verrucomicrobia bacterium]|nr:LacI family DNA-binding transcriptional regulator [Verrucomicrobiota bacterium]